ncbi:hypothetical protein [Bythopirellula polymerisocia]|uniref:hypothetical protein n=1 Tax=Bythopirellula polymerisocia TaxID=2528003 RepID=UPI0011B52DFC|nr:hypothetical protein [Bythopirellula polymerisocia]
MGDTRLEQQQQLSGKTALPRVVHAQVQVNSPNTDPRLVVLIEAWPGLEEETKSSILAMIEGD